MTVAFMMIAGLVSKSFRAMGFVEPRKLEK